MAQIGTFTRAEDGSYTGTIKTLALNIKARLIPAEPSQNDKAPALRVMSGNVEIGVAWQRTSKENTVYTRSSSMIRPSRCRSLATSSQSMTGTRSSGRADVTGVLESRGAVNAAAL
jgi:uncharacterized protein (DUF736 family)